MASRRAKKDARGGEIMRTAVNISAQEISQYLKDKHTKIDELYFDECKNGSTWFNGKDGRLRLDGWAMNKSYVNPIYTGYEIKVDRGDFLRDDKWERYLPYCHRFYFVCPRGLIKLGEITDPNVGLIYYNPESPVQKLRTVKACHKRKIDTPPAEFFQYLLFSRVDKASENPELDKVDAHTINRQWRSQQIYDFVTSQDGEDRIPIHHVGWIIRDKYKKQWTKLQDRWQELERREASLGCYLTDEEILDLLYKYFPRESSHFFSSQTTKDVRRKTLDEIFRKVCEAKIPMDMHNVIADIIKSVVRLEGILDDQKEGVVTNE